MSLISAGSISLDSTFNTLNKANLCPTVHFKTFRLLQSKGLKIYLEECSNNGEGGVDKHSGLGNDCGVCAE